MKIYFTEGFREVLKNPAMHVKLSKFKLGKDMKSLWGDNGSNLVNILDSYVSAKFPVSRFYEFDAVLKDSLLTLSISIPESDASLDEYDVLFIYYENLFNNSSEIGILLFNEPQQDSLGNISFASLDLEPLRTIINISDFSSKCYISFLEDPDLIFLEGPGFGNTNVYHTDNVNSEDLRYVSRKSYETYLLEKRSEDEYYHLYTTFINKYGLKIY